jgi:hypothetical protein
MTCNDEWAYVKKPKWKKRHAFLAEEVIVPGKMMMPFAMFFSSRMLSNLRRVELRIRTYR